MAIEITALVIGFGLLARWMLTLHRENVALRSARRRTAAIMRKLKRDRDAREQSYQASCEVACEEMAKNSALVEELQAYWSEEKRMEREQCERRMN